MTSVLFVVSAADEWTLKDGSTHPTGFWAEELTEPHRLFREAGFDITIATPGGRKPTVDDLSLGLMGGLPPKVKKVKEYLESIQGELDSPLPLDQVNADDYDIVFYPGGHGPMEDLSADPTSAALLTKRLASGKPLALLCHAPAALLATKGVDGSWPFAGKKLTGFSNAEEKMNTFAWKAKWYLQDKLEQYGADYSKATLPMMSHVVVDGNLYTGQNPASATDLAEKLIEAVKA